MQFAALAGDSVISKILVTVFVSALPLLELRGAIPLGVSLGLNIWLVTIISFIGNILPVPFIVIFIKRIMDWLSKKSKFMRTLVEKRIEKTLRHKEKLDRSAFIGLMIFVAIPLPGTGAWTGALLAALLDIRLKTALPAIMLGVLIAAILVSGITFGFASLIS
jgi:Predicted membrane protein